jgi:hypothetical protein
MSQKLQLKQPHQKLQLMLKLKPQRPRKRQQLKLRLQPRKLHLLKTHQPKKQLSNLLTIARRR